MLLSYLFAIHCFLGFKLPFICLCLYYVHLKGWIDEEFDWSIDLIQHQILVMIKKVIGDDL